jgi:uncharacterized protein
MKQGLLTGVIMVTLLAVVGVGLMVFMPRGVGAADATTPISVNVNSQQGIWVNGTGTVTVTPDIAVVNLGVSAQSSTVADALSQASAAMNKISAALTANGINSKDIQTSYFNVQQIYKSPITTVIATPVPAPNSSSPVDGSSSVSPRMPGVTATVSESTQTILYQVNNTVSVKIRAIDKVGTIIDAVAVAGGDLTRINGVSFSVEKPEQYYTQAREAAVKDAQAKAEQLAKLTGVTMGKAFYISENSYSQPMYRSESVSYSSYSGGGTSVSAGQMDITLNIQAAYNIQ